MKFNPFPLVLVTAGALSFGAQATSTDWGVHDQLEVAVAITPNSFFGDD